MTDAEMEYSVKRMVGADMMPFLMAMINWKNAESTKEETTSQCKLSFTPESFQAGATVAVPPNKMERALGHCP